MSNGEVEEPEPPAEPEPVVGVEIGQILDDAPLALREAWESGGLALDGGTGPGLGGDAGPDEAVVPIVAPPALGEPFVVVLPPCLAATSAPGSRAPRRA